jgi:hypothetical protein
MKGMHWTKQLFRAFPFLLVHSPMHARACIHSKFVKQICRTPNACALIHFFWLVVHSGMRAVVKQALRHLSESTRPSNSQMQELIRAKHRQKMTVKYSNWPIGGPQRWIAGGRMAKSHGRMQDLVSLSVRNMDQRL